MGAMVQIKNAIDYFSHHHRGSPEYSEVVSIYSMFYSILYGTVSLYYTLYSTIYCYSILYCTLLLLYTTVTLYYCSLYSMYCCLF